jgi:hypothetical protein
MRISFLNPLTTPVQFTGSKALSGKNRFHDRNTDKTQLEVQKREGFEPERIQDLFIPGNRSAFNRKRNKEGKGTSLRLQNVLGEGETFEQFKLENTTFMGGCFSLATFSNNTFKDTIFKGADLVYAKLSGRRKSASEESLTIEGGNLSGATIQNMGAVVIKGTVKGLAGVTIKNVEKLTLPPGFKMDSANNTVVCSANPNADENATTGICVVIQGRGLPRSSSIGRKSTKSDSGNSSSSSSKGSSTECDSDSSSSSSSIQRDWTPFTSRPGIFEGRQNS